MHLVKIFRALWFLSMLAMLGMLLYIYAALPETVIVQDDGGETVSISRDAFFYAMLAIGAIVNVLVYIVARLDAGAQGFRAWFYGLTITLNFFLIIALSFVHVFNSTEKFDYPRIGFIIYGSVGLIVVWAISWPIIKIFSALKPK
ncbi:MAG TPA: hypothetical protein VGK59_17415 [Ohtaekwangia sp.]